MKNETKEKPFKAILSREQQLFLKSVKESLLDYLQEPIDEDNYEQSAKQHLLIEGLFKLPVAEQNIFMIKHYGEYKSVTALAEELQITKQTLCKVVRTVKNNLKDYVDKNYKIKPIEL